MSATIMCEKCGKPLGMFNRKICVECEKKAHEDFERYCTENNYVPLTTEMYSFLSSSEKPNKWIPVSERLPEDRRAVLVTAYWHETYQVMMASYYGDGLWWCVPFNNCGEHMQRLNPKAWMPLPKPYEPQESEDKK